MKTSVTSFFICLFLLVAVPCFAELGFGTDYRAGARAGAQAQTQRAENQDSMLRSRTQPKNAEERQQQAEAARKQYEQNMQEFKSSSNLGIQSSRQSICLAKPEDMDWQSMTNGAAHNLAKKMAKNMENVGCHEQARMYLEYVVSVVGEQKEESGGIQVLGASGVSMCGKELFNLQMWESMEEDQAREAMNAYANDLRKKPGCEPQAAHLIEYVETVLSNREK